MVQFEPKSKLWFANKRGKEREWARTESIKEETKEKLGCGIALTWNAEAFKGAELAAADSLKSYKNIFQLI